MAGRDAQDLVAIGLDGCRSGWIAVAAPEPGGTAVVVRHLARFAEAVDWRAASGGGAVVAVDLPIGLTIDGRPREADRAARALLGSRRRSVFTPPGRNLLDATEYADVQARVAAARESEPAARGLSRQAFGLLPTIREVDELLPSLGDHESWLIEVHPEVSFRAWAGHDLAAKRSAAGVGARLRLVLERFPDLLAEDNLRALAEPGVAADFTDVLDAAAALWSALRWRAGEAEALGGGERDPRGIAMRIVA